MRATDFWAIVERDIEIQNPISSEKLALLDGYCDVRDGLRVLDIGCGKGWLLRRWAGCHRIEGTGLELNPYFLAVAREEAARAGQADRLRFVEGPALDFDPEPGGYDIVLCIGGTFALGGLEPALRWMRRAARPGGVVAIGEVVARAAFPEEARSRQPLDLGGTVDTLAANGLALTALVTASSEDWDRYESAHWMAAHAWAEANPDHPDRAKVVDRVKAARARYFAWERRCYGWAIFVARSETTRQAVL